MGSLILPQRGVWFFTPDGLAMAAGPENAPSPATGGRVLLVEDEYFIAIECEGWLEEEGFEVAGVCATAADAIAAAEATKPDLVVMDIRLRGAVDGIEAARDIWQQFGIRSLFASAHSDAITRQRAAAANPLGFLTKPYSRAEFLAAVRNALDTGEG